VAAACCPSAVIDLLSYMVACSPCLQQGDTTRQFPCTSKPETPKRLVEMSIRRIVLACATACLLYAQDPKAPTPAAAPSQNSAPLSNNEPWTTKTFDLRYIDPEQVRNVFSGQSHVMEANRDLKLLTARGSATFLKEVEDTIKRLDVAPPTPPNTEITVYLLASPPQSPVGTALPAELKALAKELPAKMADMQMFRVRTGQSGETSSAEPAAAPSVSLSRIRVDSTSVNPGPKGDVVSLNGLRIWLNIPPTDPTATIPTKTVKTEPDVMADLDVIPNEAVVVAKIGVDKPIAVVVRVAVIH